MPGAVLEILLRDLGTPGPASTPAPSASSVVASPTYTSPPTSAAAVPTIAPSPMPQGKSTADPAKPTATVKPTQAEDLAGQAPAKPVSQPVAPAAAESVKWTRKDIEEMFGISMVDEPKKKGRGANEQEPALARTAPIPVTIVGPLPLPVIGTDGLQPAPAAGGAPQATPAPAAGQAAPQATPGPGKTPATPTPVPPKPFDPIAEAQAILEREAKSKAVSEAYDKIRPVTPREKLEKGFGAARQVANIAAHPAVTTGIGEMAGGNPNSGLGAAGVGLGIASAMAPMLGPAGIAISAATTAITALTAMVGHATDVQVRQIRFEGMARAQMIGGDVFGAQATELKRQIANLEAIAFGLGQFALAEGQQKQKLAKLESEMQRAGALAGVSDRISPLSGDLSAARARTGIRQMQTDLEYANGPVGKRLAELEDAKSKSKRITDFLNTPDVLNEAGRGMKRYGDQETIDRWAEAKATKDHPAPKPFSMPAVDVWDVLAPGNYLAKMALAAKEAKEKGEQYGEDHKKEVKNIIELAKKALGILENDSKSIDAMTNALIDIKAEDFAMDGMLAEVDRATAVRGQRFPSPFPMP